MNLSDRVAPRICVSL